MAMPHDPALDAALAAARDAGRLLLQMRQGQDGLSPRSKRAGDFVSEADLRAESLLRTRLCGPDDHWLGEETGTYRALGSIHRARGRWHAHHGCCL